MEYEKQSYFEENEYDDVNGFVILATGDGMYTIAEKWFKDDEEEGTWIHYKVPEQDLLDRVEQEYCEFKAKVTDEQYKQVCQNAGWKRRELEA